MSPEPNNRQKHEDVLSSLDGIQRAKAPAFFYTRLRARMENELEVAGGGIIGRLLTRPGLALSIAAIILMLNITAILQMWQQDSPPAPAENTAQQLVMADYSLDTYPVYDETTVEP